MVEKAKQELTTNLNLEYSGNEEADSSDIIIPKILLMQGTSKWVPEEFNIGEIIDSVDEEIIAKKGETVELIPFILKKTWEVFTNETPAQWKRSEKWTPANDDLPWEFTEEDPETGTQNLKRQRQYSFYCMLAGATDDFAIPKLIGFRSSAGFRPGKKIASHFATMKGINQPGFNVTWTVGSETVKDESAGVSYQRFVVKKARAITDEEMTPILNWLKIMSVSPDKFKDHVVEADSKTTDVTPPPVTKNTEANYTQKAF